MSGAGQNQKPGAEKENRRRQNQPRASRNFEQAPAIPTSRPADCVSCPGIGLGRIRHRGCSAHNYGPYPAPGRMAAHHECEWKPDADGSRARRSKSKVTTKLVLTMPSHGRRRERRVRNLVVTLDGLFLMVSYTNGKPSLGELCRLLNLM